MIVSLLPAFFGPRPAAADAPAGPPRAEVAPPSETPAFGSTLLAFLGLAARPATTDGPSEPDVGDGAVEATGADAAAAASIDGSPDGDPDGTSRGPRSARTSGAPPPFRVGTTSPAGWAALATVPRATEAFGSGLDSAVELHVRAVRAARSDGASVADLQTPDVEPARAPEAAPARTPELGRAPSPVVFPGPDASAPVAIPRVAPAAPVVPPAPASTAAVGTADRSVERLDPELRTRVERMVERLADEHGIEVSVVEGYRSPERQDHLFAQGRTRPGSVVTWTRSSRHTEGRAVDLKVEGPWHQPEAYAKLQAVAREEGLGTLGMKDPGHVELPSEDGPRPEGVPRALRGEPTDRPTGPAPRMARVADVARVAQVARVAPLPDVALEPVVDATRNAAARRPARIESPPSPGQDGAAARNPSAQAEPGGSPAVVEPTVAPVAPAPAATRAEPAPRTRDRDRARTREGVVDEGVAPARAEPGGYGAGAGERSGPSAARAAAPIGMTTGADPAAAMERVLEVQDALEALAPGHRVSLRMDGTAGPVERVRVGLMDHALSTELELDDPVLAAKLRGDAGELFRALEKQGYDPRTLTLRMAGRNVDATPEAWGAAMRSETAADALRSLFGSETQNQGRDPQTRRDGEAWGRARDENPGRSRRESREEDR